MAQSVATDYSRLPFYILSMFRTGSTGQRGKQVTWRATSVRFSIPPDSSSRIFFLPHDSQCRSRWMTVTYDAYSFSVALVAVSESSRALERARHASGAVHLLFVFLVITYRCVKRLRKTIFRWWWVSYADVIDLYFQISGVRRPSFPGCVLRKYCPHSMILTNRVFIFAAWKISSANF